MTEIKGKAAVVTGAGTGIGMGIAKALAKEGAAVAVADIMLDNAKKTVEEIKAAGGKAVAIHCDVCERESIAKMKAEANAALGPIQLVFANAGVSNFEPLVDISDENVDWIIQVNLMGAMNTIRAFLRDMINAKEGHIVATASMAGLLPAWIPVHVVYSAAKMGIIGMMENLGRELEEHNVRVSTYCPGGVDSGMGKRLNSYRPERFGGPIKTGFKIPDASFKNNPITMFPPESIGPLVLHAVKNNLRFVFDHPEQRKHFRETYVDVVESCYDAFDAYEREHGRPGVVRTQKT